MSDPLRLTDRQIIAFAYALFANAAREDDHILAIAAEHGIPWHGTTPARSDAGDGLAEAVRASVGPWFDDGYENGRLDPETLTAAILARLAKDPTDEHGSWCYQSGNADGAPFIHGERCIDGPGDAPVKLVMARPIVDDVAKERG